VVVEMMEPFVQMVIMVACFGIMYASVMIPAYLACIGHELTVIRKQLEKKNKK
jgi:hypothetical protein